MCICWHACAKCARFLYEVSLRSTILCACMCVLCFLRKCACFHSVGAMPLGLAHVYMCARKKTKRWQIQKERCNVNRMKDKEG